MNNKEKTKHPIGLYILFLVEMFERFSFFGMKGILILCLQAAKELGGFDMSEASSLSLYSYYASLCYLLNPLGGFFARYLGEKRIVFIGGLTLSIGHLILAFHSLNTLFTGLLLIIIGTNLLKPNITPLVTKQYYEHETEKINAGIYFFYRGINLGSFLGSLVVGYIAFQYNYQLALSVSSVFMIFGQIIYCVFYNKILNLDQKANNNQKQEITEESYVRRNKNIAIIITCIIVFLFTISFEAGTSVMLVIANKHIHNKILGFTVPITWYHMLNPFMIIFIASKWNEIFEKYVSFHRLGIGLLLGGISFLPVVLGVLQINYMGYMSQWCYIIQQILCTLGELNVYTLTLSFITRLASNKYKSLATGSLFASIGIASYTSIKIYSYLYKIMPSDLCFCVLITVTLSTVGTLIILGKNKLQKLTGDIK